MHAADDLYLGGFLQSGGAPLKLSSSADPTINQGIGPLGRITVRDIVPAALSQVNLAIGQAPTGAVPLALIAGAGITKGIAPDGSGLTTYQFDCERCGSLTSLANLSAINFLWTGYDEYGRKQTQLMAGPNANTVTTKKAFSSVVSVVPQGTSVSNVSAGTSDIFGLQFVVSDAGYFLGIGWAGVLADNQGAFVAADATNPATSATGDTMGTYAPAGAASNGANRLVIPFHVNANQCGPNATVLAAFGVTPA